MTAGKNLSREETKELSEALGCIGVKRVSRSERVHSYDFERPVKLSRTNLRALQMIYSNVEHQWAGTLIAVLRTGVEVKTCAIEETTFSDYAEMMPTGSVTASVRISPLPGEVLIDMPVGLAARIIDRMIGGSGDSVGGRRFSVVDLSILTRVFHRLCPGLTNAWNAVMPMQWKISRLYGSIREIDLNDNTRLVVTGVTCRVDGQEYKMNIAMPSASLDGVLDLLDPQMWMSKADSREKSSSPQMAEMLDSVDIDVAIELGNAKVNMEGLVGMEVGDIIRLDRTVDEPLDVIVGGNLRFQARAGLVGRRMSVQIQGQTGGHRERPTEIRTIQFAAIEE